MNKHFKISYLLVVIGIILMPFFLKSDVFAQSNFNPPTVLPAQDIDIGGTAGACVGLATMIQTGDIHLRNIPCFIKFITQTIIGAAGSIAVLFVMIGGYKYVVLPDEDKDKAKKTITHALIGLAVSLMAWIIIDLVIQLATE
jgi:hypothetical protein